MAFILALGDSLAEGYLVVPQPGVKFRIPERSAFASRTRRDLANQVVAGTS